MESGSRHGQVFCTPEGEKTLALSQTPQPDTLHLQRHQPRRVASPHYRLP